MTVIKRGSGVLMHVSSLHGEYSVGSFGKNALAFIDYLAGAGFSYWQVLPFCIPDECGSPYKSEAFFFGNPFFIDLPTLADEGLLTQEELNGATQHTPYLMELARLKAERETLLRVAASRAENTQEILDFVEENGELAAACRFLALKRANGNRPWQEFTVKEFAPGDYFYFAFTQYHFYRQWQAVKAYANEKGIKIIGDLPIYVAADSADVYHHPDQFLLDKRGNPTSLAGVPPDYFCPDGQLWGNPLYNWRTMKKDGYAWWRRRLSHCLTLFDGVRIDHFRALESYWSVPATAPTAKAGKWVKGPGVPFVQVLREVAGEKLLIAEDLGDITDAVRRLVDKSGFPSMRVLQFAFLGEQNTLHHPHNYPENCVAYTGTHDNNTLLGYVWELSEERRRDLFAYCGVENANLDTCYEAILRTVWQSHAGILMLPLQDLLLFGADTRMNTPGRAEGNWQYRVTGEQLENLNWERYRRFNERYGRM